MSGSNGNGVAGKIYVGGSLPDIRVPMRQIVLSEDAGARPWFRVYDTSGPYTDPHIATDVRSGLAPLREEWIVARGDTQPYDGRTLAFAIDGWNAERRRPRRGGTVGQRHYARRGDVTPEME